MRRLTVPALLMLALAGPALAADAELRSSLLDLLNDYENAPTAQSLTALGEGVGPELLALAQDPDLKSSTRARAIVSLGWFPTDEGRVYLEALLANEAVKSLDRRKAAFALAEGWGAEAVEPLGAALSDTDVQLRIATARALAGVEDPAARALLEQRATIEDNDAVKKVLSQSLGAE